MQPIIEKSLRTFCAIAIPDAIQQQIIPFINKIKMHPGLKNAKWVQPRNWHITLRFLGNITHEQQQYLLANIVTQIKNHQPFNLELIGLLPFPNAKAPHALILQPQSASNLTELALTIDRTAISCGIAADRYTFNPHLTVARLATKRLPLKLLAENKLPPISFLVDAIKLIKSEPSAKGSLYTVLNTFKLENVKP
jgi:RNA 2',3'-cyclic 3'-phosphodiesterase